MKLYYTTGACSLSPHIILCESGLNFSCEQVNLRDKTTETGKNFYEISPKGQVPTLQLDDGTILTEGIAIAQYVADLVPEKNLLAPMGDIKRYQAIAWFNYIATEVHKNYGPLFMPSSQDAKDAAIATLKNKFEHIETSLAKTTYLVGETFSIADAYLFVVMRWSKLIPNLPDYPAIEAFMTRMNERAAVKTAISQEQ